MPGTLFRLLRFLQPYLGRVLLSTFCMVVGVALSMVLPLLMQNIIDSVIQTRDVEALNGVAMLLLTLFSLEFITSFGREYLLPTTSQLVMADLRVRMYEHLQRLSLRFLERRRIGEIMSRMTNDINAVQNAVTRDMINVVRQVLTLIVGVSIIFLIEWRLALLAVAPLLAIPPIMSKAGAKIKDRTMTFHQRLADVSTFIQESLSGVRLIKAFVLERLTLRMFRDEIDKTVRAAKDVFRTSSFFGALVGFLAELSILSAVWYGGNLVISGVLSVGQVIAFLIYIMTVTGPFTSIAQTWVSWQQSIAASQRVFEILDEKPELIEDSAGEMPPIKGHIRFENVSFGYKDGQVVLRNVNLEVKPGEVLALVGPSGAGKSTIVNLIMRFYDPNSGRVMIDGIDIRMVNARSLRRQIGIVPQDPFLFPISIRDNIAVGRPDATDEEIIEAAKIANAHDFILSLERGYESVVGERGCTLSGGQRQRIAIARAILRNPRILIFDEATSALDSESEAQIQRALAKVIKGRTTIIIAHRLSTIKMADKIAVIDRGEIREIGTHRELMAKRNLYYRLYESQLQVFE